MYSIVKRIDVLGSTDFYLSNDLYLIFQYFFDYSDILHIRHLVEYFRLPQMISSNAMYNVQEVSDRKS